MGLNIKLILSKRQEEGLIVKWLTREYRIEASRPDFKKLPVVDQIKASNAVDFDRLKKKEQHAVRHRQERNIAAVQYVHGRCWFFLGGSIDSSEHVPTIKRIADTAYAYLKRKGINPDGAKEVKKELIKHGKDLFVKAWMKIEEGEEPLGEEDRQEAMETFDELLKSNR